MGHLGEGKKITTVATEKIVFTDSIGQHFTMEISDLGEIIKTDVIRKKHSLSMIDCNTLTQAIVISGYQWTNGPKPGIAILEVFVYSPDWILQRFTTIGSNPQIWVRAFSNGKTWGEWSLV